MNLTTIDIDPAEAKATLAEYKKQLGVERTAEDDAVRAAYRAAARGHKIISLRDSIMAGGYFPDGRPRLAIVRADCTEVYVSTDVGDILFASVDLWASQINRGALVNASSVRVPRSVDPEHRWFNRGRTVAPTIPPRHRPRRARLHQFHILWEVEKWDPTPPVDPALLKHIRGDMWAVVATWDLTPIERMVLTGR